MVDVLRGVLDPWLGEPARKRSEGRFTLYYKFQTENEPIQTKTLKIEINTSEYRTLFGHAQTAFSVDSPWFKGGADITTFGIEELLGTKLRALYQRKKGRDLFDLHRALVNFKTLDIPRLIDLLVNPHYRDNAFFKGE